MGQREVQFVKLEDTGDMRGGLFRVPAAILQALGPMGDLHFGELHPGSLRGNHAHAGNSELLMVQWRDRAQLAFDNGADQFPNVIELAEAGAAALLIPPGCAHAIRNIGEATMQFVSVPSTPFDITDIIRRKLL